MTTSSTAVDYTDVVICGCGPTGAVLSAHLSRLGVKHVVLERETEITTDPRGIALDEDGIRIAQAVGIYPKLFTEVGTAGSWIRFIEGGQALAVKPFLQINSASIEGGTGHPYVIFHKQPALEKHIRAAIDPQFGELRSSATLTAIREDSDHVEVDYKDGQGNISTAKAKFLVGADGKTGFVRKRYLEPRGILLENSPKYLYEAVWVALNWHLTLPTAETHPDFPLWSLGYNPEQVYELFFPSTFSFICDPARPAVCGRFGRAQDRLWRFEFVVKDGEDGHKMASDEETRKIILPYLKHKGSRYGLSDDVSWPLDCITCLRSRPFSFSARSCNKWALDRVILCGDAAHVFPPFGGQGIASGFRDAISLAWRLKVATSSDQISYTALFTGWYTERKQQFERSLAATIRNGELTNEPSAIKAWIRNWLLWTVQLVPPVRHFLELGPRGEGMMRYQWSPGMPFLPRYGGGRSFPQVFSAPLDGPAPAIPTFTDDAVFAEGKKAIFQIVVLLDKVDDMERAREEIAGTTSSDLLTIDPQETTYIIHNHPPHRPSSPLSATTNGTSKHATHDTIRVIGAEEYAEAGKLESSETGTIFPRPPPLHYDPNRIRRDLGFHIKYVVVRWDRIVFAACRDVHELKGAMGLVGACLAGEGEARSKL